jgi:excisionase family DNA binding protein
MAIDTSGYITVAEAAKRLGLSIEQVRRKLRDGKLKGRRVGQQWFVEESACVQGTRKLAPLISRDILVSLDRVRARIAKENPGLEYDVVAMVRRHRDEA